MKDDSKALSKNQIFISRNNPKVNTNIFFITKNYDYNCEILNHNEKLCEYCHSKFYSKFNKNRHVKSIHSESKITKNLSEQTKIVSIEQHINNNQLLEVQENNKNFANKFIGFKRHSSNYSENAEEKLENQPVDEDGIKIKPASNTFLEEKNLEFCISPTKQKIKKNIHDVIVDNFYAILKNNEYYSLGRYFIFKDLIIGNGKFGTVWFGIDVKNARPVAIKASNEEKRNSTFQTEIAIMKKLAKYKLFSKVYDQIILNKRIYLIETLQGPDLYKLRKFCGGKFSITTVYKIGIEILNCLRLLHKI